ncbi:hypothetical protein CTAYLR_005665 [Chrysophaeum taylorii]|uniref:Serine hydrolase domain-containing protein n=1 Tax=Chrysophaeum taylorii TaxID=2483200 RepID=A0AAD7UMD5_9STRA|nr:hypothetical protein CTAYLR_005665 [Chrysophaeum taylorii]
MTTLFFDASNYIARLLGGGGVKENETTMFPGIEEALDLDVYADMLDPNLAIKRNGRPLRLLCLHGHGSNNDITAIQMCSLGLHSRCSVDLLHGAQPCAPQAWTFTQLSARPFKSWWDMRGGGLEAALRRVLLAVEEHGPYDGLYGFSQGSAVASWLSLPGVAESLGAKRTWRFVVCAGGVDIGLDEAMALLDGDHGSDDNTNARKTTTSKKIDLPSLHIIGRKDSYITLSRRLVALYDNPVVLSHPHAHEVPVSLRRDAPFQAAVHDFLKSH